MPSSITGGVAVDFSRPMDEGAGGLTAFAVKAGYDSAMAVEVKRGWSARARVIQSLLNADIANVLLPLGHGPALLPSGEMGYFVISRIPPGRPVPLATPWSESDLLIRLLRPVIEVLTAFEQRGVTHRAIRPDNVFLAEPAGPVTLGCAWTAPPAAHQPAAPEPPYVAVCAPCGRGDGAIADDIYALGYLMVWLALGRDPLAGQNEEAIIARKLNLGSPAAIMGDHRLPSTIADLARSMLADDPDHRPSATLLADPAAARARRPAARSIRRSQRAAIIAGQEAWTPRVLAHLILRNPAEAIAPLRNGAIDHWLRRGVGDPALAVRYEEAMRSASDDKGRGQGDARLVMKAVAVLDPLAPMNWRGAVFWPDGIGAALEHALHAPQEPGGPAPQSLVEVAEAALIEEWAGHRAERDDFGALKLRVRTHHKWLHLNPTDAGAIRLCHALNPLSPCTSALLPRSWVVRLNDLLPAMEASVVAGRPNTPKLWSSLAAFIAARRDERTKPELGRALAAMKAADPVAPLRLLATLQTVTGGQPVPRLAGWLAEGIAARLADFHSQSRRQALTGRLAASVTAGDLPGVLDVLENAQEVENDTAGRRHALARMAAIAHTIATLEDGGLQRKQAAIRLGHDVAWAAGVLAIGVAAATSLLS